MKTKLTLLTLLAFITTHTPMNAMQLPGTNYAGKYKELAPDHLHTIADTRNYSDAGFSGMKVIVSQCFGMTELHVAATIDDIESCRELLSEQETIEATDIRGWTPLHYAAYQGNAVIAYFLLQAGANPNAQDRKGHTPLHIALLKRREGVCRILLRDDATDPDAENNKGQTPMHYAAVENLPQMCLALYQKNAFLTVTNKKGFTPLMCASSCRKKDAYNTLYALMYRRRS